jgi:hypothetical protein
MKLPGGGLAGAAEDPALLLFAGLKRERRTTATGRTARFFSMRPAEMELRPRQASANAGLREVYISLSIMRSAADEGLPAGGTGNQASAGAGAGW